MIKKGVSFGFWHRKMRNIKSLLFSRGFGDGGGVFLPSSNEIPLQDFKESVILRGHNSISTASKQFLIENNKNYDTPQFKSGCLKASCQFSGSDVIYL